MFYRKLQENIQNRLTVQQLFDSKIIPTEEGQDFTASRSVSRTIAPITDETFAIKGNVICVWEGEFKEITTGSYADFKQHLTCCAAVLFYAENSEKNQQLFAFHAKGGEIKADTFDGLEIVEGINVIRVIYATPLLLEDNGDSVDVLADIFGTEKICIIDGFGNNCLGKVLAGYNGNLTFS